MAPTVINVAPPAAEGKAHLRVGFHDRNDSLPRHGNLDHGVGFGAFSSGSSPG